MLRVRRVSSSSRVDIPSSLVPPTVADGRQEGFAFVRLGSRSGQSAVEFALVLPLIMLVIFGAVELGVATYDKAVLTNASREGARAGIVAMTPRLTDAQIQSVVTTYAQNNMITFKNPGSVTADDHSDVRYPKCNDVIRYRGDRHGELQLQLLPDTEVPDLVYRHDHPQRPDCNADGVSLRALRVMTRVGDEHHGLGKIQAEPARGTDARDGRSGLSGHFALAGLAIDVGMMMLARNEVQNAADAAALSGAAEFYKFSTPPTTVIVTPNWTRAQDTAAKAVTRNKVMNTALRDRDIPDRLLEHHGHAGRHAVNDRRHRCSPTTGRQSR